MKFTTRSTILLFLVSAAGTFNLTLFGMENNVEMKREAATTANTEEATKNSLHLPAPLKKLIGEYYTGFDWSWLPAFRVNVTPLAGENGHKAEVNTIIPFNSHTLISGDLDGNIRIWDFNKETIVEFKAHYASTSCLLKINENIFASGSVYENDIKLWDINTKECIATLKGHTSTLTCLIKVNKDMIASGSTDCTVKLWDISNPEKAHCIHTFTQGTPKGHQYHPSVKSLVQINETTIASGGKDHKIEIWDINKKRNIATLYRTLDSSNQNIVWSLALLNENTLVSGSSDGTIQLWDIKTSRCITEFEGHEKQQSPYSNLLFDSPVYALIKLDEHHIASGSSDKSIKIWDLRTQKCIHQFNEHTDSVSWLMKWDDYRFVSCSRDKTIKIFEIDQGQLKILHENFDQLWMKKEK